MHAPKIEEPVGGLSLETFTKHNGVPAKYWHHQSDRVLEEWHVLTWDCGCVASYVSHAISGAELDFQVEHCDRHDLRSF
jgi:hypothetical protein